MGFRVRQEPPQTVHSSNISVEIIRQSSLWNSFEPGDLKLRGRTVRPRAADGEITGQVRKLRKKKDRDNRAGAPLNLKALHGAKWKFENPDVMTEELKLKEGGDLEHGRSDVRRWRR